ncbi:hypothetical protein ACIRBX_28440 [Kitasatospora sp. NPDC096147]|uniref:hypothetical protein n=1 Tax=Kitasatospora sp. NPDC096147 TaxID=3364093 RepID=UPI0038125991
MAGQQYGPFKVGPKILLALVPFLTLGLLGMVPSLVLALRRRRVADVVGAVLVGLVQLFVYVYLGLNDPDSDATNGLTVAGGFGLVALWLGGPAHFLVMDSRHIWGTGAQPPAPAAWYPQPPLQAQPGYQPYPQHPAPMPAPGPLPAPQPQPYPPVQPQGPATQGDLQQLGELLRRQAQEGRP